MQKFLLGSIAATAIAATALAAAAVAIAQPTPAAPPGVMAPPATPVHVMRPQTRNAVVEKVREHFAELDINRDGYLTKNEAKTGRAKMKTKHIHRIKTAEGHAPMKDAGAMFDRLDANGDGSISREEFNSGHQKRHAVRIDRDGGGQLDRRMHRMRAMHGGGMRLGGRMFEQADANRDSRVSLQEATEAALKHFDMADIDRDGTLSPDERQEIRVKMKEIRRATRAS